MGARRRKHTAEFKIAAVRLVTERGVSVAQAARDLGIDRSLLTKWKRELGAKGEAAFPGKGRLRPLEEEVARLRRELNTVRQERDILKKATAFFAKESR
jgi:transposase